MRAIFSTTLVLTGLALVIGSCQENREARPGVKVKISSPTITLVDSSTFNRVMRAPVLPDSVPRP